MARKHEVSILITARDKASRVFRSITNRLGRLRVGIAGILGALGFGKLVDGALKYGSSIDAMAKRASVGVKRFQAFAFQAERVNVSQEAFGSVLRRIRTKQAEALNGNARLAEAFGNLGIKFEDLRRYDPLDILLASADAMQRLGELNVREDLFKIGESELMTLIPMIQKGPKQLAEEATEFMRSVALSQREITELAQTEEEAAREMREASMEINKAIIELAPAIRELSTVFAEFVQVMTSNGPRDTAVEAIENARQIPEFLEVAGERLLNSVTPKARESLSYRDVPTGPGRDRRFDAQQPQLQRQSTDYLREIRDNTRRNNARVGP